MDQLCALTENAILNSPIKSNTFLFIAIVDLEFTHNYQNRAKYTFMCRICLWNSVLIQSGGKTHSYANIPIGYIRTFSTYVMLFGRKSLVVSNKSENITTITELMLHP